MAKDAYYFSHDSNARYDPKITAMRSVYGTEGYGWFWIIIEMMREADGYKLDMQGKYTFNAYAMQMHTDSNAVEHFVQDCINEFNLFSSDGECFWSESLLRRMELRQETSEKRRNAANKRWENTRINANASIEDANVMQGNRSKGNKENKYKETIVEIINYLNEVTGKSFSSDTKETIKLVSGRLTEGKTYEHFRHVIDVKTAEWLNDEKMSAWLKPNTLFAQSNFESYLNQKATTGKQPINQKEPRGLKLTDAYDGHYQEVPIEQYDYTPGMTDEERELNLFAYKKSG